MTVLAVVFVIFAAAAARRALAVFWIATLLALSATGTYLVRHTWWDSEDVSSVKELMDTKAGFEGTDEYDPLGDDHTDVPQKQPEAAVVFEKGETEAPQKPELRVLTWTAENRIVTMRSAAPAKIQLRLLHYPAWRITLNDQPAPTLRTVSYDAVVLLVPAGESRIEARFTQTADRTIGGCLTAISGLAAGLLLWPLKRRTP